MTLVLDPPRARGPWTVAALCDRSVLHHGRSGAVWFVARKVPVAILLFDGTRLAAFDPAGRPLDPDGLEAVCPGVIRAMTGGSMGGQEGA